MNTKTYLQSFKNGPIPDRELRNIYLKDYLYSSISTLDRSGLFFSLFNKIFDPTLPQIPHLLLSRFELFKGQSEYYRIDARNKFQNYDQSTYILLFNINPVEMPLEILNDFLKWFCDNHLAGPRSKILIHYNYNLDLTDDLGQSYILGYFQLIQKFLGKLPDSLSLTELEKKASLENHLIIEAGSQWSCLDNYLVHLCLSKGASLLQPSLYNLKFQIISEEALSPYHSIQKIKKLNPDEFDIACPFQNDLKEKNFFKHPEDLKLFYYLMYNNIFNV